MASKEGLQKHTLFLREGDMEYLKTVLPAGQASHAVRTIVAKFVDQIRNLSDTDLSANEPIDIDNL